MTTDLVKQDVMSLEQFEKWFDKFFEDSQVFIPYIKVNNKGIVYKKKISETEYEETILENPKFRLLYMCRAYQINYSTGNPKDFKLLAETSEFLDSNKTPFVLFDYSRKVIVQRLKNMNDIKDYYGIWLWEKCERRAIVYLHSEETGVVKMFLKLTQLYNKNDKDNWFNFNSPIKNWAKDLRDTYKSKIVNYVFTMSVKDNWVKPLTTFYPVFETAEELPVENAIKMAYDIFVWIWNFTKIKAENLVSDWFQFVTKDNPIPEQETTIDDVFIDEDEEEGKTVLKWKTVKKDAIEDDDLPF